MIPLRDTLDIRGGFLATVGLIGANVILFGFGLYNAGFWTLLVALLSIWLFGGALEKRLGPLGLIGVYLILLGLASLVAGLASDGSGAFLLYPPGAALGLGLVLLALVPNAKIAALIPIPFAMGLYEVPAAVILLLLAGIALLLNGS